MIKNNQIYSMLDGAFDQPQIIQSDNNTIIPDQIVKRRDGKSQKHINSTNQDKIFLYLSDDKMQVRMKRKQEFEIQLIEQIDYEQIKTLTQALTTKPEGKLFIVFIIEKYQSTPQDKDDKDHIFRIITFYSEVKKDRAVENINRKISQCTDQMKNLIKFNYLGIEENVRKAIEYAIISDKAKREVYTKINANINERIQDRKIKFTPFQKALMLKALVSDHKKYQKILIQEKIEAYDIEKNRQGHMISQQVEELDLEGCEGELEGYSEKRKMDGVVVQQRAQLRQRQQKQAHQRSLGQPQSYPQQLYLNKIPYREQFEIDSLLLQAQDDLGNNNNSKLPKKYVYQWYNKQNQDNKMMEIENEEKSKKQDRKNWHGIQKVPIKQYDIFSKPEILYSTDEKPKKIDSNDFDQRVSIQAVKFMYRLMKLNLENCVRRDEQPLAQVLDSLKDLLTFYEKRFRQTSSVSVMLKKANTNYMRYKKLMDRQRGYL